MFNDLGARLRRPHDGHAKDALGPNELLTFKLPVTSSQTHGTIAIQLAKGDGQKSRAKVLLNRMYSNRGYGADHQLPSEPSCVTFVATSADDLIGTLTLTVDSPLGLALDRTFGSEIDQFRGNGAKLCELTKFAFETSAPARPRLAALFHIIFIYESMHFGCTDVLIEVNPGHRRFYEVMLGFTSVGDPRENESVRAPSQLMRLNLDAMRRFIDARGRSGGVEASRSLYSSFFSREEEEGIRARLTPSRESSVFFRPAPRHKGRPARRPWRTSHAQVRAEA